MIKGRTYHQLLQVDPSADTEVISVVHRKLAQRYHPDRDEMPAGRQYRSEIARLLGRPSAH